MSSTRRSFLETASAGIAVAACPVSFAGETGENDAGGEPKVVRLALIGCGGQGLNNLRNLFKAAGTDGAPAVRAVAVCDVDSARLAEGVALANLSNGGGPDCRGFADHAALLKEVGGELHAAVVGTPDHQHAPPSIAAADAGLAVYCEKPLANSVADCDAILAAAERNGVLLQVGSHERSNDRVRRACELVRGGALGELKEVVLQMPTEQSHHRAVAATTAEAPRMPPPASLDYAMWLGDASTVEEAPAGWPDMKAVDPQLPGWMPRHGPHFWWRFLSTFGAGEITDRGAHILDVAQLATGRDEGDGWRPVSVTAEGDDRPGAFYDAPMRYEFTVTFPSGPPYVGTTEGPRGVRFEGEKGSLFVAVHGGRTTAEPADLLNAETTVDLGRTASHHANFLRAVIGEESLFAPVRAGHRTAVLCHQINAALKPA